MQERTALPLALDVEALERKLLKNNMKPHLAIALELMGKMIFEQDINKRKVLYDMSYEELKAHLEEIKDMFKSV